MDLIVQMLRLPFCYYKMSFFFLAVDLWF